MECNNIGQHEAKKISEAMAKNQSITSMRYILSAELGWNYIGPIGAMALANALMQNRSLTELCNALIQIYLRMTSVMMAQKQ